MDKADITCIQWNTTQPRESEVMPRAAAQMHLEMSILNEVSQTEKGKRHMMPPYVESNF